MLFCQIYTVSIMFRKLFRKLFPQSLQISTLAPKTNKVRRNIRSIPESLLIVFGEKLSKTDFSDVYSQPNPTKMVEVFQYLLLKLVEETFPLKSILISNDDQVWFNEELRALKRNRLREYNRHGKSQKYKLIKYRKKSS